MTGNSGSYSTSRDLFLRMNSEGDYTLCNLDAHSYGTGYASSQDNTGSLYGYSMNNRSIDTGQHGYYSADNTNLSLSHGGVDLSLVNGHVSQHQNINYNINGSNSMMGRGIRNTGYQDIDGQLPQCLDPYTGLAAINCDTQTSHGGIPPHSPGGGRAVYGSPCIDTMGQCSIPNGSHTAYLPQMTPPSPVKSESPSPQNLQAKPFRWMQIKRNPGKQGKPNICYYSFSFHSEEGINFTTKISQLGPDSFLTVSDLNIMQVSWSCRAF